MKWFFALIIVFFLIGCVQVNDSNNGKINVLVSILPQKEFVESIAGDKVNVIVLLPPGASPATYSLTSQDLINIQKAKIYFRIGLLPFEKATESQLRELNPGLKIVNASSVVELRKIGSSIDPHLWLSPLNMIKHCNQITLALSELKPGFKNFFEKNNQEYVSKLRELDSFLKNIFQNVSQKNFLVFHPSWGYFARDFGLNQIAIEQDGKEPTASQLKELINLAREKKIRVVFVQKQFSKSIAESIASELNGVVVSIDPLAENYLENMHFIGEKIASELK